MGRGRPGGGWNARASRGRAVVYVLPVVLLLCVTLPHLDQGDFRKDSARYAAVGLAAWRSGELLDLSLGPDLPYYRKPPLALWIHGLFLHLLGVSLVAARIPVLLAAAGTVLATVFLARRLGSRATATAAGSVLALTLPFFRRTREISLDLWLALFLVLALALLVVARRRRRLSLLLAGGACAGLALLVKPLVGLILFPVLGATLLATGRVREIPWLLPVLAAAIVVAAPWHVAMAVRHGAAFTGTFLGHEVVDRALGDPDLVGEGRPLLYYLKLLLQGYWPWLPLVPIGVLAWARGRVGRRRRPGLALAAAWVLVWLAILTAFPDKASNYELPLYPLLALLAAEGLCRLRFRRLRGFYRRWLALPAVIGAVAALVVAVLPLQLQRPPHPDWAALCAWLEGPSSPREELWAAACGENASGRIYLATGRWVRHLGRRWGRRVADLPPGSTVLHGSTPRRGLDPREEVLFRAGSLSVTRIAGP